MHEDPGPFQICRRRSVRDGALRDRRLRHRRQWIGQRGQPSRLQPQGAGRPYRSGRHHVLGIGLNRQPAHAAGDHERLQLIADQGARHTGHPGRLRRHLAEVSGRPLERTAARRGADRGSGHPGGRRHRLLPAGAVLHERSQVLHERLPRTASRLLEGRWGAVGPALRRVGTDRVLQRERLHESRSEPGRPPGHAAPDARRRQGPEGVRQRHGARPRPLAPRDVAGHSEPALRQQPQRSQRSRHEGGLRHQDGGVHLHPAAHPGDLGRRHDQPVDGAGRLRQPPRPGERQIRHDHRDVRCAGRGDPDRRAAASTPT